MRRILLLLTMVVLALSASAQKKYVITGTVSDSELGYPLKYATATATLKGTSASLGTMTDSLGQFSIALPSTGQYKVKIAYIGYESQTLDARLSPESDSVSLGVIKLVGEDKTLSEAVVTATAARVQQVGDTTMFNAEAYRVPEGSTLEALVKQLPGVEVSDDGSITWNGKSVTEFLVNGKDFFKGDTKIAMKNLPTDLVSKIKAYDKKSDYAEQTGIDDGEETTVLDIQTKRELNGSWINNVDLAYGNHKRYSGRLFLSRFDDRSRYTLIASANNTGDRGFWRPARLRRTERTHRRQDRRLRLLARQRKATPRSRTLRSGRKRALLPHLHRRALHLRQRDLPLQRRQQFVRQQSQPVLRLLHERERRNASAVEPRLHDLREFPPVVHP